MAHERYTPTCPDWPVATTPVGYPLWDALPALGSDEPDDELDGFLDAGDPPVVFTLGTARPMAPGSFYATVTTTMEALPERRALVLGGPAGQVRAPLEGRVLLRPYAPLTRLLPRARVVVHHGGAGTTQAALAAGCPAVVLPQVFDQWYHARRVRELGAGTWLPPRSVSPARLAAAITSMDCHPVREAARLAGDPPTAPPAVRAADAIEKTLTT